MDAYARIQTERQKDLLIYFIKMMYLDVLYFDVIWFDFPHDIFVYIQTFLSKLYSFMIIVFYVFFSENNRCDPVYHLLTDRLIQ